MSDADLRVSGNPPWGVVRAVVVREPYAVVLDDLNGDFREVLGTLLRRERSGWEELAYQDDVGLPGHEEATVLLSSGDVTCVLGSDAAGAEVRPGCLVREQLVTCDADGWWLVVEEGVDPSDVLRSPRPTWL